MVTLRTTAGIAVAGAGAGAGAAAVADVAVTAAAVDLCLTPTCRCFNDVGFTPGTLPARDLRFFWRDREDFAGFSVSLVPRDEDCACVVDICMYASVNMHGHTQHAMVAYHTVHHHPSAPHGRTMQPMLP